MKIYDISMEIYPDMPVYKDREEKKPVLRTVSSHNDGEVHQSEIKMDLHTGTHIDAPLHMLEDGSTSEIYDWTKYITECRVLDYTELGEKISASDLKKADISRSEFLIFKTKNSLSDDFTTGFVYLDSSGADYLVQKGVKGVGIDSLGIERAQPRHPTHRKLLGAEIIILEGLRLKEISAGSYQMIFLPLKIREVEGVPGRAVLIDKADR